MSDVKLTRRTFLKGVAATGLNLFVGIPLSDVQTAVKVIAGPVPMVDSVDALAERADQPVALGVWVKINPDDSVTLTISKSEMGQGVRTSLAMLIAEELEADWSKVRVEQAPAASEYSSQATHGSTSIRQLWTPLRQIGATAREMLIAAAAQTWNVKPESCRAERGYVLNPASNRRLSYGELALAAAKLPAPQNVNLKPISSFTLVGKPTARIDNPLVASGKAVYGLDVRVPNMLYAVIARCPVFGGELASYDDAAAKAVPGVKQIVKIDRGIAVVAQNTWAALKGREALKITWNEGQNAKFSSAAMQAQFRQAAGQSGGLPGGASKTITATYDVPYLAHATMEPMNAVADVRADRCELWLPTQDPQRARQAVASRLGLPGQAVTVNVTLLGGGFGRRSETDFAIEAVDLSKAVGAPVKVMWSRDDDLQHDFYRPASQHVLHGGLDTSGKIVSVKHQIVASGSPNGGPRISSFGGGQGAVMPYAFPTQVEARMVNLPAPTGFWRSVYASQNVFATESFFDELALAAGKDPYQLRRDLASSPRLKHVLEVAADKAGWGKPLPKGSGRGITALDHLGSYIAQVVELSVSDSGAVRVQRVVCAVDCGVPINPSTIEAQIQGAVVDGLSTALKAAITIADGRVQQSSWHNYDWFRIGDMPAIEVHIIPSQESPGGMGELGYPGIPPAVANAIFAATGKRVRQLPIRPEHLV